jgi:hypothetical protein
MTQAILSWIKESNTVAFAVFKPVINWQKRAVNGRSCLQHKLLPL